MTREDVLYLIHSAQYTLRHVADYRDSLVELVECLVEQLPTDELAGEIIFGELADDIERGLLPPTVCDVIDHIQRTIRQVDNPEVRKKWQSRK